MTYGEHPMAAIRRTPLGMQRSTINALLADDWPGRYDG